MPPRVTLAASEYGIIGSRYPDVPIIDLVGLHDPVLAHNGFDAAYIMSRKPDVIWFPHNHYTGAVAALRDDRAFQRDYAYYPAVFSYGIALRKTSPLFPQMLQAVDRVFAETYPGRRLADYRAEPLAPPPAE